MIRLSQSPSRLKVAPALRTSITCNAPNLPVEFSTVNLSNERREFQITCQSNKTRKHETFSGFAFIAFI